MISNNTPLRTSKSGWPCGLRNLLRLKRGVGFEIDDRITPNPIFEALQELGNVSDGEMYQTFNMGMGFSVVASQDDAEAIVDFLGEGAKIVGRAVEEARVTVPELGVEFDRY